MSILAYMAKIHLYRRRRASTTFDLWRQFFSYTEGWGRPSLFHDIQAISHEEIIFCVGLSLCKNFSGQETQLKSRVGYPSTGKWDTRSVQYSLVHVLCKCGAFQERSYPERIQKLYRIAIPWGAVVIVLEKKWGQNTIWISQRAGIALDPVGFFSSVLWPLPHKGW